MTDQMGCLVESSPCSLGVADRGDVDNAAQNGNVNVTGVKIQAISPLTQCIEGGGTAPDGGTFTPGTYPL
ncbi:MAG: hypothetical protein JOZ69_10785 [Myxococcales bacterium]|nr:hypothetical protein [Myxococcales bacterium]